MIGIRRIGKTIVSIPVAHRVVSCVRDTDRVVYILVEVETDVGEIGVSYVAGFSRHTALAVCALLDELESVLAGADATALGATWDRMWNACTLIGHTGLGAFAISAIDIALWDLQGKLLGAPLHRLLGSRRTSLPAYASDGCWLQPDPARVADEAAAFAAQGFRAVKVRCGRPEIERDLATLDAVRRAVGHGVEILIDVNQGWTRERARLAGRQLADRRVAWLEEPLAAEDIAGLAELRRLLPVSIVAGENAYLPAGIGTLLDAGAVSRVMPDLQRVGGITGWVRASALAERAHVPLTSHLYPEVSAHLLAASRTAGPLEWVSWLTPILEQPLVPDDGVVQVPQAPGIGIAFDPAAVRRFRLD